MELMSLTPKELMFVSQMAFFAHVSDPAFGGEPFGSVQKLESDTFESEAVVLRHLALDAFVKK